MKPSRFPSRFLVVSHHRHTHRDTNSHLQLFRAEDLESSLQMKSNVTWEHGDGRVLGGGVTGGDVCWPSCDLCHASSVSGSQNEPLRECVCVCYRRRPWMPLMGDVCQACCRHPSQSDMCNCCSGEAERRRWRPFIH